MICALYNDNVKKHFKSLRFFKEQSVVKNFQLNHQIICYCAFKNTVYASKSIDLYYQKINIYILKAYFGGGNIDGINTTTASIFFLNNMGG